MTDRVFGFKIQGESAGGTRAVRETREEMERFEASAAKMGMTTERLQQRLNAHNGVSEKTAATTKENAAELAKLDAELEVLLGRLNPNTKAMNDLSSAQGLLTRSYQAGLLGTKQYQEALTSANGAYKLSTQGAQDFSLSTAAARRELIVLGHEAMTGNFSRMPGSFMVLAKSAQISSGALIAVVAPIALLAGGAAALAMAYAKGHEEMQAMNGALALTSNFSGMTRGNMETLAAQVSKTGTITIGTAKDIVTSIVATGRYSAENVALLAGLVGNYAHSTGESADKATAQLVKMFEDPAKASETLNAQYHFLSVSQQEHIKLLQASGQTQEALTVSLKAFAAHIPDHNKSLGTIGAAWLEIKKAASWYAGMLSSIGKTDTFEQRIESLTSKIAGLTALNKSAPSKMNEDLLASEQRLLTALLEQKAAAEGIAKAQGDAAKALTAQSAAQLEIDKSKTVQIRILTGKRDDVAKDGLGGADKQERLREMNKEILDLQRSIGAEGRALLIGRLADESKIFEAENQNAIEQLDANLKLGTLTQQRYDKERLALDQAALARKKSDDEQRLAIGGLTELNAQELKAEMRLIDVRAIGLQQKYDNAQLIVREALLRSGAEADAKAGAETINAQMKINAGLDEQIEKLKEHNAQIGLTGEQVDALKAKEMDRGIKVLETLRAQSVAAGAPENSQLILLVDAQIEKLRTLQGLLQSGAVSEANHAAAKKLQEEGKRAANEIERALTDGLMRSFEKGGSFSDAFKKGLEASFKTMVLRPIISALVTPFSQPIAAVGQGVTSGVMESLGLKFAGNAVSSYATNALGLGGGGFLGTAAVPAAGDALIGGTAAAGTMIEGTGLLGTLGGAGAGVEAAMAAIPGVGWAALAAVAAMSLFGGGGGPKASDSSLRRRADGSFGVEMNNVAGGDPDMSQVLALNALLNDPTKFDPSVLAGLVNTQVSTGSPADTATLLNALTQRLAPAASAAADSQAKLASDALAASTALQALNSSISDALNKQVSATKDAASAAKSSAEAYRRAAAALTDSANALKLGTLSPMLPLDQYNASRSILNSVFSSALGGNQDALDKLSSSVNDFLTSSRAYNAASPAYTSDFELAQSMLQQAASVSTMAANVQEQIAAIQTHQLELLGGIKDELSKPHPDPAVLSVLGAQLVSGQAQADGLQATLDTQLGTLRASFDAGLAINNAALGAGSEATIAALASSSSTLTSAMSATTAAVNASASATGASLAIQTATLAAQLSAGAGQIAALLEQLVGKGKEQDLQSAYTAAKAQSDSLRDAQLAFVRSQGGSVASGEDIASGVAQQVWYYLNGTEGQVTIMGAAYGDAFNKAYALYKQLPGHADGLDYVPYDNYAMRAHKGEAVVDAQSMAAFRKYGIPAGAGGGKGDLDKASVDRLLAAVEKGNQLLMALGLQSTRDLGTVAARIESAIEEGTDGMGRSIAGAVQAKARA